MKHAPILGDYSGRWDKNGRLEIQFTNNKGKLEHQTFSIEAESKDEPVQAKQ